MPGTKLLYSVGDPTIIGSGQLLQRGLYQIINGMLREALVRWPRFVGQLGGLIKVYSSCRSCCQNPFASISLPLLLRLWGCGQGA